MKLLSRLNVLSLPRRRPVNTVSTAAEVCESRMLLSAKPLKGIAPELSAPRAKPTEQSEAFDGVWYIRLNGTLQGNISLIQRGNEVKSETNVVFPDQFEGKASGKKLKISCERPGEGNEKTTITWKVSLTDSVHFSGVQIIKTRNEKITTDLTGEY